MPERLAQISSRCTRSIPSSWAERTSEGAFLNCLHFLRSLNTYMHAHVATIAERLTLHVNDYDTVKNELGLFFHTLAAESLKFKTNQECTHILKNT